MWWYRKYVVTTLPMWPVWGNDLPGTLVPNFPQWSVPVKMLYRYRYQLRYRHPDWYRRYRYWCCTEITEVSGTGIDVVPNLPKRPGPVIPVVHIGCMPRYVPFRTHPRNISLSATCKLLLTKYGYLSVKMKKKAFVSKIGNGSSKGPLLALRIHPSSSHEICC